MTQTKTPPKKKKSILVTLLKVTLLVILLAVAAFFVVGRFVLSGEYDVSRETTINAPPSAVHAQVGDLRQWPNWLPFTKHDPTIKTTIEQPTGVGARQHWTGDTGNGELTFDASDEDKGTAWTMVFDKKYTSKGSITYAPAGGGATRVTWRMTGRNDDFVGKWMAAAMGAMVGPMFDEGLADLKKTVEGPAPAARP